MRRKQQAGRNVLAVESENYRAEFFNPVTLIGFVRQSSDWAAPACPDESRDWVLYLLAWKDAK